MALPMRTQTFTIVLHDAMLRGQHAVTSKRAKSWTNQALVLPNFGPGHATVRKQPELRATCFRNRQPMQSPAPSLAAFAGGGSQDRSPAERRGLRRSGNTTLPELHLPFVYLSAYPPELTCGQRNQHLNSQFRKHHPLTLPTSSASRTPAVRQPMIRPP